MVLGAALFVIMMLTAIPTWRGDRQAATALIVESVVWLYVDRYFEGPHLIHFGHAHSLVFADLVAIDGLILAAVCLLRPLLDARTKRTR
jgi:hypothetical protein